MDQLRYHLYHCSKKTIVDLLPTSCSGRGHILQAFYGMYLQLHCLDDAELNPCEFGFYQDDGALLPDIKQHCFLMTFQCHADVQLVPPSAVLADRMKSNTVLTVAARL